MKPLTVRRRRVLQLPLAAGAAAALAPWQAWADDYPSRPIRMVVPFPAGGPTDIVARPLSKLLGEHLRQQVVVDNRGGAGGSVGATVVANAPPDGYTLLMGTVGTAAINPALYKKLAYDAVADFTPLATTASAPVAVVATPSAGINTLGELIARAKAAPNTLTYGSAGNGTPGHLAGAMFCSAAGIQMRHIPYKGSAPAVTDLLGGQIQLMFDPLQSVLPHVQSGKLKLLAVTSRQRAKAVPQTPTVAEVALPDFEMTAWWAVFAPARLPADITRRLTEEIQRVVRGPEFESALGNLGVQPLSTPLAELQKTELAKWGAAVRTAGVTLE
ncbi:MAG: tripartite tricarboxylate transporter substrate binding protein [Ottowia sp.]|nr:tripartite tricarboxylate transporter substrate binding protein [Ottowia sp.]HPR45474.1 tripartite tricarboxylate transporter substrate binding protein [Ottowia sp.]